MDEREFKRFLKTKGQSPETIRSYVHSARNFDDWLVSSQGKHLGDANPQDISTWGSYLEKKHKDSTVSAYFSGIKQYYIHKGARANSTMLKAIDEILSKVSRRIPKSEMRLPLSWDRFRDILKRAEEKGISKEKLALLNLLWSEIKSKEILELRKSHINFEKRFITCPTKRKTYRVTHEAWNALEKYIPIKDRHKNEKLFTMTTPRSVQKITADYFKEAGQTPRKLNANCREDLIETGRRVRFDYGLISPSRKSKLKHEQKVEIEKNLSFDILVQEIKKFGRRIRRQLTKTPQEKELQRLLEGYLFATFPNEIISHEFRFRSMKQTHPKIDIAVGKDQKIPVEVKSRKVGERINDYVRYGTGQVNEFLEHFGSKKGILVIGDQERDPRNQEMSGLQGNVFVVII